ncbi:MAG TPA: cytochrome c biogenesis protein CcsA [Myxococcales bacterium]|nr:cytochrome c biogenesis protein CcsA [Myxococcales bacterium]
METLLVHLALVAYASGTAAFLTWLVQPDDRWPRIGRWLLLAGAVVHFASFAAMQSGTVWKAGQLFSLLAACTVTGYIWLDRKGGIPIAGVFVAPLTLAVMAPAHIVGSAQHEVAPRLWHSGALVFHVAVAALGTAALALAFGVSALYLASEKQAKSKRPGRIFARLTSLDSIDRTAWRLAVWGFVFLSATIATGSVVSSSATGSAFPFAPKQAFAVLAWALFAAMIQARLVAGWRGRRIALLVVIGFVLLAGVYAGLLSASPSLVALGAWI